MLVPRPMAAKAHSKGEEHNEEGHLANGKNNLDRKGSAEKNGGQLKDPFGCKFQRRPDPFGMEKAIDDRTQ